MTRHRFESIWLVLGSLLVLTGAVYVLEAVEVLELPLALRLALMPSVLMAGAVVSVTTFAVRRIRARRAFPSKGAPGR